MPVSIKLFQIGDKSDDYVVMEIQLIRFLCANGNISELDWQNQMESYIINNVITFL